MFKRGFLPEKFLRFQAMGAAYSRPPFRDPDEMFERILPGIEDPDGRYLISQMDEAGIDIAVIASLDFGVMMGQDQEVGPDGMHDFYKSVADANPGRVVVFAGCDPRRVGALDVFDRAITQYACAGYKIYPNAGFYPYDPICYPFYERCQSLEIPVLAHTAYNALPHKSRFGGAANWSDVLADFPDMVLWWGHAGYPRWWEDCLEIMAPHLNSYLELSLWQRFAAEDERAFVQMVCRARDAIGPHRMLWGSGSQYSPRFGGDRMPGMPLQNWVQWWRDLPSKASKYGLSFNDEEVEMVLGKNAERCLKLAPNDLAIRKYGWTPRYPR